VPVVDRLVIEMIIGFFVGFAVIVAVTALIFRSLRIAAISIVPNLLPALACFVVLGMFGITLRIGTVLFLSVSIGGLFNTTIHLAARTRQRLSEGETDPDAVIEHALRKVGPPALFTAVILSLGFSVFMLSRFPDLQVFGLLSMTVLLAGFVSDLCVTTVLLRVFYDGPTTELPATGGAHGAQPAGQHVGESPAVAT
jgi:predicted RND superfamily exporter protein